MFRVPCQRLPLVIVCLFVPALARASFTEWTINPSESTITLSLTAASLSNGQLTTESQVSGTSYGFETSVFGRYVSTPVDPGTTSMYFAGGMALGDSWYWGPLPGGAPGVAPANFGAKLSQLDGTTTLGNVYTAFRDVNLAIDLAGLSGPNPGELTGAPTIRFYSGSVDYFSNGSLGYYGLGTLDAGEFRFVSGRGMNGEIIFDNEASPTVATMKLTFEATYFDDLQGTSGGISSPLLLFPTLRGTIIATATAAVPEASSVVMLLGVASPAAIIWLVGRRRRAAEIDGKRQNPIERGSDAS